LPGSEADTVFTFSSPVTLENGVTYHLVISRSGAGDNTNNYCMGSKGANPYASGTVETYFGTTWTNVTNEDADLEIVYITEQGKVYKTDADVQAQIDEFIGFTESSAADGATVSVKVAGVATGLTGLTAGAQQYIGNTRGAIGASAGTNTRKACIALSATTCVITNIW